jgi:SAM-dependent methyltransferase
VACAHRPGRARPAPWPRPARRGRGARPAGGGRAAPGERVLDVGAATSLPFPDASFDLVVCQQRLQLLGDRASVLAELWRVLLPGGRVAVAVWGPIERSPGFAALAGALERHADVCAAAAVRWLFCLPAPGELRACLAGAAGRMEQTTTLTPPSGRSSPPSASPRRRGSPSLSPPEPSQIAPEDWAHAAQAHDRRSPSSASQFRRPCAHQLRNSGMPFGDNDWAILPVPAVDDPGRPRTRQRSLNA